MTFHSTTRAATSASGGAGGGSSTSYLRRYPIYILNIDLNNTDRTGDAAFATERRLATLSVIVAPGAQQQPTDMQPAAPNEGATPSMTTRDNNAGEEENPRGNARGGTGETMVMQADIRALASAADLSPQARGSHAG